DQISMAQFAYSYPTVGPKGAGGVTRFSSISEPEDVLHPSKVQGRNKIPKKQRHKSIPKRHLIGAPNCFKVLEAAKEGNSKAR
ncbi:hypothetical protein A2U01_0073208, partial [Trifolium medium]|nr:hypothetical protein [Trifolium medium]